MMNKYKLGKRIAKIVGVYLAIFIFYFTLVGWLGMNEEHGFFWLTPVKLLVRLLLPGFLTLQFYYQWEWMKK